MFDIVLTLVVILAIIGLACSYFETKKLIMELKEEFEEALMKE